MDDFEDDRIKKYRPEAWRRAQRAITQKIIALGPEKIRHIELEARSLDKDFYRYIVEIVMESSYDAVKDTDIQEAKIAIMGMFT